MTTVRQIIDAVLPGQEWISRVQETIHMSGSPESQGQNGQGTGNSGAETQPAGGNSTQSGGQNNDTVAGGQGADTVAAGGGQHAPDWAVRRIDDLTGKWRGAQREVQQRDDALALANSTIEQLRKQVTPAEGRGGAPGASGAEDGPPPTKAEIERRVREGVAAETFNQTCSNIASQGKSQYPDWGVRMNEYSRLDGLTPPFVEAAIATGKAPEVLYAMAADLNEASRIMALSPIQMAAEMVKYADKLPNGKEISRAGAEGGAVRSQTRTGGAAEASRDPLDPERPMADWMQAREKAVATRQGRRYGG